MTKLANIFEDLSLIGIDTSPFIYFVERNPKYLLIMREIFRRITDGDFEAVTSVITLTEVLVVPFRKSTPKIADEYKNLLFNGANFRIVSIESKIAETAARIRANYNLRTPDALQIATALENGCQAFLCNDKGMRRVKEMQIILLDEIEL
jgi:predicted nucleic acid-binding protein